MRKAFLILAHKNPSQLGRLVRTLDDGASFFFIHVDKSSDLPDFEAELQYCDKVRFVKREKAEWARFGLVQATINGLRAIAFSGHHFQQVFLLSGQDYPIKRNEYLTQFAEENKDRIFLEYHHLPAPEKWQPHGGLYRVNKYFFGFGPWNKFRSRSLNMLAGQFPFLQRKMYQDMKPYAGSMWWILNKAAVDYILDFIENNPGYIEFHQHTFAPDEVFFQTILLNAKDLKIAGHIVNTNKRFIKWKDQHASHPEIIDTEHLTEILDSDDLFARKFDYDSGSPVLDQIDHHLQAKHYHEAIL